MTSSQYHYAYTTSPQEQSYSHVSAIEVAPATHGIPPAPSGTFRLFRLLSLYPTPEIQLQTFPYRDSITPPSQAPYDLFGSDSSQYVSPDIGSEDVCPAYDAISYAWNPNSSGINDDHNPIVPSTVRMQSIMVHTSDSAQPITLSITSHLLYGLLTAQEVCSPSWLFVDAICIDQMNPDDKARQVQGMDRIYRGAERVLVWLGMDLNPAGSVSGDSTDGSRRSSLSGPNATYLGSCLPRIPALVQDIKAYLGSQEQDQQAMEKGKMTARPKAARSTMTATSIPLTSDPIWRDLERLRLNPYFSRLWIVQEMTLARDAVLLYGRHVLPCSIYAELTMLCENIINNLFSKKHDAKIVNQLYFAYNSRMSALVKLRSEISHASTSTTGPNTDAEENVQLMKLLIHNIRKSKASVPLDRVYAIMGLLSGRMKESIRIDYTPEALDRYWIKWVEFVQAILSFAPEAAEDVFSNATVLNRLPDLPSWCPNLADASEKRGIVGPATMYAGMPSGLDWKSNNETRAVSVIPDAFSLRLLGMKVDEVAHVVDLSWIKDRLQWARIFVDKDGDIESGVAQDILESIWKFLKHVKEVQSVPVAEQDTAVARCLVANAYDGEAIEPPKLWKDYLAFTRYLEHYVWGPATSAPLKKSTRTAALTFGDRFQRMARNRALFVTKDGRPGLGSCNTRPGDILCVVMNCRVPYLLRRHGDTGLFHFVGETYVDNLMHGEAFVGHDMTQENPEEFVVC